MEKKGNDSYNYIYASRLYARKGNQGTVYYHQDGLGSTLIITDSVGAVKNKYQYDAFGNPTIIAQTLENSLLFTGELHDQSGFIYLRARYYDPAAGRFITQDTVSGKLDNPLSQNLYTYCGNNPVNYTDPSGNMRCDQAVDLMYGLKESVGETIKEILNSPWAVWELVKDIKNGNLSLTDLADGLGESVAGPIKHLIANSGEVWDGDPTDAQVQEYGKNLGDVIQQAILAGGAVKTGIKAIDKLIDASKGAGKVMSPSAAANKIVNAERVGSGLKGDIYHRAASYLSESQISKGTVYDLGKNNTLLQVEGSANGKTGIFECILNQNGEVTHQLFKEGGVINGIPN
ncbi:Rhs family protein [Desulfosporosinus sp. I2]|uniref:RHS repeat-associated core domain-containing protein n=1 Tax=Desulfosporosinus sp. I2 TaxID=1617025 RepID=UPI0005EF177C|nr:RHS repeat-associated core domain-containing protein [Desulfosporosinus sp. I2]KJR46896.1 Rhs family protein [Desulfosporosinus sp. I2]